MNADPNDESLGRAEDDPELETEGELVEVGAVTDTKGGPLGANQDAGNGWQRF